MVVTAEKSENQGQSWVKFNATDKSDLATKLAAFKNSKTIDNYNALNASLIQANTSRDVYATLNTAIANAESWTATTATEGLRTKYNNGEYANDVTAANIYAEYQAAEIAALVAADATEFTSVILNHSFETGDMTGWNAESRSDTGVRANSNGTYTTSDVDGDYLFNSWGGSAENNVYQTIPNLPAGTYQLSALLAGFNGEELILAANETTNSVVGAGDKTTGYTVNVIFTLDAVSNVTIKASNTKGASTSDASFIKADNFALKAYSDPLAALKEQLAVLQTDATALLTNDSYANVTGTERSTLSSLSITTPEETEAAYNTAISDITAATAAFTAAKANYDALATEIAYAKTIGVTTADNYAATSESTAASVVTNAQNLKVVEYTTINTNYNNNVTSLIGDWDKGSYDTTSGQSYQGGSESYFDKWSGSATDLTSSMTVSLPSGQYALMVAGRGVSTTTMSLSVQVGDDEPVSTPFLMNGDTGKGIDTNGATNFSDEGTYSNGNAGRGWQYRYITFEGGSDVTITISGHLNNGTWQSFYAPVLLCNDATYGPIAVEAAKVDLRADIDGAPAALTANIGTGVFQMPEAGVTAYSNALAAAEAVWNDDDATLAAINEAQTALATAIETYNALEVNAPTEGQLFNVSLASGKWSSNGVNFENEAMTYLAGDRGDMGGYNIKYQAEANQNLAQAFTFTKVSGNNYKMSQIDADGNVRYMSTGVPYSGITSQIRTTTDADKALVVTVIPTTTEGKWNLKNTEANQYIGAQDAGVYTVNSHIDFNIVETTKPSISIDTEAAGWGTTILPFAQELPQGVKAYTCADHNDDLLTLLPVDALEANKPYIIEGSWNATLTGDAQGTALIYTKDYLTGVYSATSAPVGSYVMQKNNDKVGFYKVDEGEGKQPTVGANRCYLTVPSSARAFFLFDNETGISAIEALTSGEAQIFDINGVQQPGLQKGMNIIRKADGQSYKVMVK